MHGLVSESTVVVVAAVAVSLMLAAGLWLSRRRAVVVAAALVAGMFAVFDIAEVAHQLDESRRALAALAVGVALGHAAITLIAAVGGAKPARLA